MLSSDAVDRVLSSFGEQGEGRLWIPMRLGLGLSGFGLEGCVSHGRWATLTSAHPSSRAHIYARFASVTEEILGLVVGGRTIPGLKTLVWVDPSPEP